MAAKFINPEVTSVAVASLVRMISLLGAELVAGKHHDDFDIFEHAVRSKLYAHVDGVSSESTAAGVAVAHGLVEPVLRDLRERVRRVHAAEPVAFAEQPSLASRIN